MVTYLETNIFITPLDERKIKDFERIKNYLEINGKQYPKNCDNSDRTEFYYFLGNSAVFIEKLEDKVNIIISSLTNTSRDFIKHNIEKILND